MTGTWQLARFLVVGSTTVLVDLAAYSLLLMLGLAVDPAKAVGFVTGTVFAYFANRLWTFAAVGGGIVFLKFAALYLGTLVVNVAANAGMVGLVGTATFGLGLAFVVATAISAGLNFLGMKYIVFQN